MWQCHNSDGPLLSRSLPKHCACVLLCVPSSHLAILLTHPCRNCRQAASGAWQRSITIKDKKVTVAYKPGSNQAIREYQAHDPWQCFAVHSKLSMCAACHHSWLYEAACQHTATTAAI